MWKCIGYQIGQYIRLLNLTLFCIAVLTHNKNYRAFIIYNIIGKYRATTDIHMHIMSGVCFIAYCCKYFYKLHIFAAQFNYLTFNLSLTRTACLKLKKKNHVLNKIELFFPHLVWAPYIFILNTLYMHIFIIGLKVQ